MTFRALRPAQQLLLSFAAMIGAGTLLLKLPWAVPPDRPIGWIDALFTATSASCVTGLIVRDTGSEFTLFGQLVILALIQLGGLGIMSFSLLIAAGISGRLSLAGRELVETTLAGSGARGELWALLRLVFSFTAVAELLGVGLLLPAFLQRMPPTEALWAAVFHSISAFCNAGFSLWSTSLVEWAASPWVNTVFMMLIVLGGLGFLTVYELRRARGRFGPLSLHAKLVLTTTAALILAGAALILVAETGQGLSAGSLSEGVLTALFQSVTARTAGFNTVEVGTLAPATLFVLILLMYVGGSPGSAAGGVKTTTLAVLVVTAWSRLRKRRNVNAFRRTLSPLTVQNTLALALAAVAVTLAGLLVLLLLEHPAAPSSATTGRGFLAYLFETVSALNTVGLSTGVTDELQPLSRLWVTLLMYVGRLGPLTFAAALFAAGSRDDWRYPEEEVVIG